MPIPYPRQDISARDDNGSRSIGYKDENGLFRSVSLQDPLPMYLVNTAQKRRKFVVMAGQSNVFYGNEYSTLNAAMPYISFDPRLKQLGQYTDGGYNDRIIPFSNHLQNNVPDLTRSSGWVAKLAELLLDHTDGNIPLIGQYDELIVVQITVGGTGWSEGRWAPTGVLFKDYQKKIRMLTSEYDAECVGIFWAQGENDSNATMADYYRYYLDNFVISTRDIIAEASANREYANKVPFVTFQMNPEWVAAQVNPLKVQSALANIGTRVPYTSSIDITGLPAPIDTDDIHYDVLQMMWLADRFYTGWQNARANNLPVATPGAGQYLIYRQVSGTWVTDAFQAIWQPSATPATANLYSILGDVWKYRTSRNTYKYRARYKLGTGEWKEIIFEQLFTPFTCVAEGMPHKLISSELQIGSATANFMGLAYSKSSSRSALLAFDTGTTFWGAIGQQAASGTAPNQIVVSGDTALTADFRYASECELYAIVD